MSEADPAILNRSGELVTWLLEQCEKFKIVDVSPFIPLFKTIPSDDIPLSLSPQLSKVLVTHLTLNDWLIKTVVKSCNRSDWSVELFSEILNSLNLSDFNPELLYSYLVPLMSLPDYEQVIFKFNSMQLIPRLISGSNRTVERLQSEISTLRNDFKYLKDIVMSFTHNSSYKTYLDNTSLKSFSESKILTKCSFSLVDLFCFESDPKLILELHVMDSGRLISIQSVTIFQISC
ncbi:hypothetical protein GEMRC1_002884 [Eukaryota sp. GEM-RC1]